MDLEQYLLSKSACGASCSCGCDNKVDSDTLRLYGHKAAAQFVGGKVPMNDSIAQMAKEAKLNHEQVKRVVEHANNLAFSQMFKAGFSQNITFPMADTSVVMQNLEAPVQTKQASLDIVRGSKYVPGQERVSLEAAFGYNAVTRAIEKTAAPTVDRNELVRQYIDKVSSIKNAQAELEILADSFELKTRDLDRLIKQAQTEGFGPDVIGACIDSANPSTIIQNYLADRYGGSVSVGSLDKIAQMGMQMMRNPITDTVATLQGLQEQLFQLKDMVEAAQMQVGQMLAIMQQPTQVNPTAQLFSARAPAPGLSSEMGPPPGVSPGPMPNMQEAAPQMAPERQASPLETY